MSWSWAASLELRIVVLENILLHGLTYLIDFWVANPLQNARALRST
jgi:hypothetical protein